MSLIGSEDGARTRHVMCGVFLSVLLPALASGQAAARGQAAGGTGAPQLRQYAGSYDADALLRHPRVRPQLAAMLGAELAHLQRNLNVKGAIDVIDDNLSIEGNAPHQGTEEEAVVCVSSTDADVSAAILSRGAITVYSRATRYEALPRCIKDWITQANSQHRDRVSAPPNVRLATPR